MAPESILLHLLQVITLVAPVLSQTLTRCPLGWQGFGDHCYHFVFYPELTYSLARTACELDGAYLLSVNTEAEHTFISQWLTQHDMDRAHRWWTSGIGADETLIWEGDGTASILDQTTKWGEQGMQGRASQRIVYKFTTLTNTFLWSRQYGNETSPYVCEISLAEAFRINQAARDFSFGTPSSNPEEVARGPRFTVEPGSIVVVGSVETASIECAADSNPPATYKWYKKTDTGELVTITTALDSRYSLTNGRVSFQQPVESLDAGTYYCEASNPLGSIRSHPVTVTFGDLGEFSNDPPGAVGVNQYSGTYIDCNPPRYKPMASFQWYKGPGANFLRTDLNVYQFVSYNGKLYFSETQLSDAGMYHCVVILTAPLGQMVATKQPPSRTSLGIELIVRGDTSTEFGPFIHNDFPAVFPAPALRGNDLRLECFAYGRLPLYYSWYRDNGPIPAKAELQEENKVLVIRDAQLEDSGNYTCRVERSSRASDTRSFSLIVEAAPFFVFPLRDQHVDINSQVSLRCEALAVPLPVYSWYKDGKPLTPSPGDVEITGNVVVIKKADPVKHNGMYQCSAKNLYGTRFSSAQVRVLAFAPSFEKFPLDSSQMATVGGSTTIICQPEAAPAPEITFSHNGRDLGVTAGIEGRVMMLDNGNLLINQVQMSDQGEYRCTATNSEGQASSTGYLTVVTATTITLGPVNTQVQLNSTAFLACRASFDRQHHDLVYTWTFNNYIIDIDNDPHYRQAFINEREGLYIINAQYMNEGRYTCSARTVDDQTTASAFLTVRGPPGEPAGLYGQVQGMDVELTWTLGATHGSPVIFFIIEHKSNFNPKWRVKIDKLYVTEAIDDEFPERRRAMITDLSPGSSYSFRVRAVNNFGVGDASVPSEYFKVPDAPPTKAPTDITYMFSSVGMLSFSWTPLSPEDLTASGVGYRVYWRLKSQDVIRNNLWQQEKVLGRVNSFVTLVGYDHYYLEYEVKVAAFNYKGQGPNSTVTIVMSSEDLPVAAPTNLNGEEYNGTAVLVYFDPIPQTRIYARGKILGYQINYWLETDPGYLMGYNHYCGEVYEDCGAALVIGLSADSDYWFNAQAFSLAGLGPIGEDYRISTYLHPPKTYTEYVLVGSHGPDSVYVSWRGIRVMRDEEPLRGYKLRWWPATESMVAANWTVINGRQTWGVIRGVQRGIVYALRVLGFNAGGDGKNSPTVYFTLEGQVVYNPETTEILAVGSRVSASVWTLAVMTAVYLYCTG